MKQAGQADRGKNQKEYQQKIRFKHPARVLELKHNSALCAANKKLHLLEIEQKDVRVCLLVVGPVLGDVGEIVTAAHQKVGGDHGIVFVVLNIVPGAAAVGLQPHQCCLVTTQLVGGPDSRRLQEATLAVLAGRVLKHFDQLFSLQLGDADRVAEWQHRQHVLEGDVALADARPNVATVQNGQRVVATRQRGQTTAHQFIKVVDERVGDEVAQGALLLTTQFGTKVLGSIAKSFRELDAQFFI